MIDKDEVGEKEDKKGKNHITAFSPFFQTTVKIHLLKEKIIYGCKKIIYQFLRTVQVL